MPDSQYGCLPGIGRSKGFSKPVSGLFVGRGRGSELKFSLKKL